MRRTYYDTGGTSAVTARATTISTSGVTFTFSGTLTASDKVSYQCTGL